MGDWKEKKTSFGEKSVFCQLPILEELGADGESKFSLFQSLSIARYCARVAGMDGGEGTCGETALYFIGCSVWFEVTGNASNDLKDRSPCASKGG